MRNHSATYLRIVAIGIFVYSYAHYELVIRTIGELSESGLRPLAKEEHMR